MKRYVDRPGSSYPGGIPPWIDESEYVCQAKMHGWRCIAVIRSGEVKFFTRFWEEIEGPKVPSVFADRAYDGPDMILDGEWMSPLINPKYDNDFVAFDIVQIDGTPLFEIPLFERMKSFNEGEVSTIFSVVNDAKASFTLHFHRLKELAQPQVEGVVLKRKDSTLIGSTNGSANNPGWIRCRFS